MSTQEQKKMDLADVVMNAGGGHITFARAVLIARAVLAAGYERRRDHVAEADELRKQVRG